MKRLFFILLLLLVCAVPAFAQDLGVMTLTPHAQDAIDADAPAALYCGPTQGAYRYAEQTIDLSQPFVLFGQDDCWAMVAKGTQDAFGPVGWIESALLDTLDGAPLLTFDDALSAMIEEDAPATNDPLASAETIAVLPRGEQITILAQCSDWLYVQAVIEDLPARVFIPAASVL